MFIHQRVPYFLDVISFNLLYPIFFCLSDITDISLPSLPLDLVFPVNDSSLPRRQQEDLDVVLLLVAWYVGPRAGRPDLPAGDL